MDIFSVITLFGGLAFFLYGMHLLSSSLEKMVGGKLERILRSMTSNRFKALLLGMGITIAIQSSSAMTVMLVGLVNSGIMELGQTIGVIMGSNIGTTVTAWILSLSGITSDNVFVQLLKPESFSPIVALIGIILIMFTKSSKKKDIGSVCVGFAILMTGMTMMSGAVKPLADLPQFKEVLTILDNPIVAILVGAGITALIQSSAASLGILQSLAMTGSISFSMALPVIMGQNIGTCITALLSSIGTTKSAKRVTAVHIYFNVLGTVICLSGFYIANSIFHFTFTDQPISSFMIAVVHSAFNLITTFILLPFCNQLAHRFLNGLTNRAHRDHDAACVRCAHIVKRMIGSSCQLADFFHISGHNVRYRIIVQIRSFSALEENIRILRCTANDRMLRVQSSSSEFRNSLPI